MAKYAIDDPDLLSLAHKSSTIRACFNEEIKKLNDDEPEAFSINISD